jgi:ADP-ribosylglycohydrolase
MSEDKPIRNRDRAIGAYTGAAIGDAMGGPVECNHAMRIRRLVGEIKGLLPYEKPYTFGTPGPGYCLCPDAGCVTDDTFIRADFTRFYLSTEPPRTPDLLVDWMLENADFSRWWQPVIEALHRVKRGEVTAEEGGLTFFQGGGIGWWTPVGILFAGDPDGAAAEAKNLSRIWKAPLERDLLGAVQAGVAECMRDNASIDSMLDAMMAQCRPLGQKLMERAIDLTKKSSSVPDLVNRLYHNVLMPDLRDEQEPPREVDAPVPPVMEPLEDSDERYLSSYFAEQVPLSLAGFLYAKGEPDAIPVTCMLGRDADSTATTTGSWVGAMQGESGLPEEWVETVYEANINEVDIRKLAEQLAV